MNKEQRRQELKRARFERSRSTRNQDAETVTNSRLLTELRTPPPAPPRQPDPMLRMIGEAMAMWGIPPAMFDATDKEPKQAEVISVTDEDSLCITLPPEEDIMEDGTLRPGAHDPNSTQCQCALCVQPPQVHMPWSPPRLESNP